MISQHAKDMEFSTVPWKSCRICKEKNNGAQGGVSEGNDVMQLHFKSPKDFTSHLKMSHCRREGGSYVCTYGPNKLCKNLPLEGVSGKDYDIHLSRYHVAPRGAEHLLTQQLHQHALPMPPQSTSDQQGAATVVGAGLGIEEDKFSDTSQRNYRKISKDADSRGSRGRKRDRWTVYNAKVNMAALLNDPRPGRRQPDFFTKTWGVGWDYLDLSPSPLIPDITIEHFRKYQEIVLPLVAKHEKVQSNLADVKVPIDAFPPLYLRAHDKRSSDIGRVPSIFHSPSFDLSDADTFHQIFAWDNIETSQSVQKLHQEKLSHYLDIIEVQIARQVALKSEDFFHVMSSHEELQSRLAFSTEAILTLRSKMRDLSGGLVKSPLTVLAKSRKRQRLQAVTRKLRWMATLHQTQPTVQQLLSSSDYVGALDLINTAKEVLNTELSGIQSFRHLGSQLTELGKAIYILVGDEFLAFITKHLNKPLAEDSTELFDEDKFTAVFMGLLRQHSINFVDLYKEEAIATIKANVKQTVISYVSASDTFSSDNSTLADQMRSLNFNKWLLLMEDVFHNLIIIINRVKALGDVMRALSCEAAGLDLRSREEDEHVETSQHNVSSQQDFGQTIITEMFADKICKELRDLLIKTCEHANERCSKVITARAKDMFIERLTSFEFFTLMSSVERFAKSCEQICGCKISSNSVRGCLQGYNIKFLNKFNEERKNKLNLLLDNERWRAAEVPNDLQALLTHCELCEQLTTADWVSAGDTAAPSQHVVVDNRHFVIVGSALALLKMLIEYCACLDDLPKSAPDILTKLTEILKLFNSRSSQLVLGAGALQLAGLKTISAKNLALLQRSLELMLHYLPQIRRQFSVYLVESKALMLRHLDSVTDDYSQHTKVVRAKLREIASGTIDSCVNQWEIRPPMPSLCFRTLCKQLNKFHEAICDIIEPSQLQQLFREVNSMVKEKLKDRLAAINITLLTGPQQGLIMSDIAYFMENCSTLNSTLTKVTVSLSLSLGDIIVSR